MVFPTLLCPHFRLRRESPVSSAIRIWQTAMFIGRGRKMECPKDQCQIFAPLAFKPHSTGHEETLNVSAQSIRHAEGP
jgi:hypothetical protein